MRTQIHLSSGQNAAVMTHEPMSCDEGRCITLSVYGPAGSVLHHLSAGDAKELAAALVAHAEAAEEVPA